MSVFIGIDPGASGGAAMLDSQGSIIDVVKFKDMTLRDMADLFCEWSSQYELPKAIIEKVHSMPKQGVSSTFKFGENFGMLQMALASYHIEFDYVTPQKWQGAMNCRTKGDKNVTKARAQQRWPHYKITHANADCLLIADYCRTIAN